MAVFDPDSGALRPAAARNPGRLRKILVVVDDTPECHVALRFSALRAARNGYKLTLLYVLTPSDFKNWGGVDQLMQAEAREKAESIMQSLASQVHDFVGLIPEILIREGNARDEVLAALAGDRDIRQLLLASAARGKNPGPLITAFSGAALMQMNTPLLIVPGRLTDDEIDDIA